MSVQYSRDGFMTPPLAFCLSSSAYSTVFAHEPRMRAIVHLANHEGPEVCQDKVNIARQTALHMVRFSANARDVFLLRALGSRVLSAAAEAHDRQIRVTTAAVLAQVQLQPVNDAAQAAGHGYLHQLPDEALPHEFRLAYPRMGLHQFAGGLGLRAWARYTHAAFVGMWATSFQACIVPVRRSSALRMPAYPALEMVVQQAEMLRTGAVDATQVTTLAADLCLAWEESRQLAVRHCPSAVERRDPASEGHWVHATSGRITEIVHMPDRAQRALSKPVNRQVAQEVRAAIVGDESLGAGERLERAAETMCSAAGHVLQAHPWQASQTLSLASHEVLVTLAWRYCLPLPGGLQPPQECGGTCQHRGMSLPGKRDTAERVELAALTQREWVTHAVRSCVQSGGVRRLCHDAVLRVLYDMLRSAGFEDVEMEDRWWDEGDDEAKDTRRPDITCFNPIDRCRYVIDVVGAWAALDGGRGVWRPVGHAANGKARFKWRSYKGALRRQESGDRGWLVKQSRATDQFVPFAFEVGGALGDEAEAFLRLAVKVAAHCRRGVGDLEHWSAMSWSGHWRQRIGVEIARGLARSVERAATGGRSRGSATRGRNAEWDPSSC